MAARSKPQRRSKHERCQNVQRKNNHELRPQFAHAARASIASMRRKVLKDLIEHHAEEEETEMFPEARRSLGKDELARLGLEIEKMKQDLS